MEMNTRLQVEHPVTEAVTGVDLVEWQLRVAAGEQLPLKQHEITCTGHAFEGRLYAESPERGFLPATGVVQRWKLPSGASSFEFGGPPGGSYVRVDSGVQEGDAVGVHYDPMIAKVLATGPDRSTALANLHAVLSQLQVSGLPTNQDFMKVIAAHPAFAAGGVNTSFIPHHEQQLMSSPCPSASAVALAWLAGYAATLHQFKAAYGRPPGMGAWQVQDSKRLNHSLQLSQQLTHPLSGATFTLGVLVKGPGAMSVRVQQDGQAEPEDVDIWDYSLEGHRMTAVVDGDMMAADVSTYTQHGGQEQVVDVWVAPGRGPREWCQVTRQLSRDWQADAGIQGTEGAARVVSPMPGKIIKVDVEEGAEVVAGARLVVVEAMKMEHAVKAPRAGVVAQLPAQVGAQVQEGDVLAVVVDQGE